MCCDKKSTRNRSVCSLEMEAIHSHSHTASSCSGSCVPDVHTVSPADFNIILRNLSVGVGSFCSPGHPHWHTSTLQFLHHTLHFLSSHTPFVSVILFFYGFCFAGCFWLTDSSWMSWLRQRQGPECVGWLLEPLCMGKAHTTLPHTFLIHAGDIPHSAGPVLFFKSFSIYLFTHKSKSIFEKNLLKLIMQFHKITNLRYLLIYKNTFPHLT